MTQEGEALTCLPLLLSFAHQRHVTAHILQRPARRADQGFVSGNEPDITDLVAEHEELIRQVGAPWFRYANRAEAEELLQAGRLVLVERAVTWDRAKGPFSSHARPHLKRALMEQIRSSSYSWLTMSEFEARASARRDPEAQPRPAWNFDPLRPRPHSVEELLEHVAQLPARGEPGPTHDPDRLAALLRPLDARQRYLVTRYLGLDGQPKAGSLTEAANGLGMTRQSARTMYEQSKQVLEKTWGHHDGWPVTDVRPRA